jgi:RNA polymerase sigma-70 factor (ECF subfamily)
MMDSGREGKFVAELTEIQLPLRLYVQSLMPGDPAAHDVAQHANATIWKKREDFEPGTNFKAWAFAIARFEVLNYRKQQARDARPVFSEELELTFAGELATQHDDVEQRHEALQTCLWKLRPKDRELLMHRYARSGPLGEYADRSGRSVVGLKVTLRRLRYALLECMQRQLRPEQGLS